MIVEDEWLFPLNWRATNRSSLLGCGDCCFAGPEICLSYQLLHRIFLTWPTTSLTQFTTRVGSSIMMRWLLLAVMMCCAPGMRLTKRLCKSSQILFGESGMLAPGRWAEIRMMGTFGN